MLMEMYDFFVNYMINFFFSTLGPGGFHPKIYNTALRLFKEEMLVGCGGGNPDKLTKLCLNRIPEAANEWKRMKSFVSECLTFILIVLLILCIRGVIVSILVEFKCVSMFISNESNLFSQDFCSRRVVVKILKFLLAVLKRFSVGFSIAVHGCKCLYHGIHCLRN